MSASREPEKVGGEQLRLGASPQPYIFVVMPFRGELDEVFHSGIKLAASDAGAFADRLDQQHYAEDMVDRVRAQIAAAQVVVADMTGGNPNVYYEVGYAHAIGKPVVFITQSLKEMAFDVSHYFHVEYAPSNVSDLRSKLVPKLIGALRLGDVRPRVSARCPLDVRVMDFPVTQVGSGDPEMIEWRRYVRESAMGFVTITFRNVRSVVPFVVDQVYLLAQGGSTLAIWRGPNHPAPPEWWHKPDEGMGPWERRYVVDARGFTLPYFGVHPTEVPLFLDRQEAFGRTRLEILAQGTCYAYEFVLQVPGNRRG